MIRPYCCTFAIAAALSGRVTVNERKIFRLWRDSYSWFWRVTDMKKATIGFTPDHDDIIAMVGCESEMLFPISSMKCCVPRDYIPPSIYAHMAAFDSRIQRLQLQRYRLTKAVQLIEPEKACDMSAMGLKQFKVHAWGLVSHSCDLLAKDNLRVGGKAKISFLQTVDLVTYRFHTLEVGVGALEWVKS